MAKLKTTFIPSPLAQVRTTVGAAGKELNLQDLVSKAKEAGFTVQLQNTPPSDPCLVVFPEKIASFLQWLRDDLNFAFDFMQCISATDFIARPATDEQPAIEPRMELLYVLYSFPLRTYLNVKVLLPRDNATVDTVCHLFRCANWYERECYDLLGVKFKNHPHLERILLPPDWEGHPLRRDYEFPETYNGMKVPL